LLPQTQEQIMQFLFLESFSLSAVVVLALTQCAPAAGLFAEQGADPCFRASSLRAEQNGQIANGFPDHGDALCDTDCDNQSNCTISRSAATYCLDDEGPATRDSNHSRVNVRLERSR
jgi:hypothetical protein